MEEWANINHRYQVSNIGNVRSLDYSKPSKSKYHKNFMKGRVLKKCISKRGYYVVNICIDGKAKIRNVHSLVAEKFIQNPNKYKVINHKDSNPLNNEVSNLEWCTQIDNIKHSIAAGRNYKKTVINIETGIFYDSLKQASDAYGIKYPYLSMMLNGRCRNMTSLVFA